MRQIKQQHFKVNWHNMTSVKFVSSSKQHFMFSFFLHIPIFCLGGNYSLAFWISTSLLGVASLIHMAAYGLKRRQEAARL